MNAPQTATLAQLRTPQPEAPQRYEIGLTNSQGFELAQRAAKLLASSSLVPKDYQGNLPNCVIALNMAARVGADPLMVMQNLVIVHGRPTWSAQFLIATVNTCGRFSALRYEFFGAPNTDEWGCRAWAIEKASGEKLIGTDVTIAIAKKEGWFGKSGSKWQSIPQQMLMYRAGSWWTRAYAPELSMGLHTSDEMADVYDAEYGADGAYQVTAESLRNAVPTAAVIDQDTGEITGGAGEPSDAPAETTRSAMTADKVRERLAKATDVDILDADADLIREIGDSEQRAALTDVYRARREELTAQPAEATQQQTTTRQRRERGGMGME
jgi:hypothetical protein